MVKLMALPKASRIQAMRAAASQKWADLVVSAPDWAAAASRKAVPISRPVKSMSAAAPLPKRM
jgi:hypothetical protein